VKQLWSPWRMEYILREKPDACIFCEAFRAPAAQDREYLILRRGTHCAAIMNLFPYNNGHLMIVPYAHQGTFEGLPPEALVELMTMANQSVAALRKALAAEGFNIGVNLGKIAGAGIGEHVHMHVVPRWSGDTNFMTALSEVRCIPESLQDSYDKLQDAWDEDQ
jgi:ATP adenylyltransferase